MNYYVLVDQAWQGPFEENDLRALYRAGELIPETILHPEGAEQSVYLRDTPITQKALTPPPRPVKSAQPEFDHRAPLQRKSQSLQVLNPQEKKSGEGRTSKKAQKALIWSIVSIFCVGFITGPYAMYLGWKAQEEIAEYPGMKGTIQVNFALIISRIVTVGWIMGTLKVLSVLVYLSHHPEIVPHSDPGL